MTTNPSDTVATEDVTPEELGLATRNHGFLLEAMRYPVTPVGLHYLLIHFDIPSVDPQRWRMQVGGAVERTSEYSLDELRRHSVRTERVTMECAGNGRLAMSPRPLSQPWNIEAVGTGEWTGIPLREVLEEAGLVEGAKEVLFTGLDRGVEKTLEQQYERSLPLSEALREDVLLAYELNGQPLPPQHGFPLRLVVPGWYGMGNVKWLSRITVLDRPYEGFQNSSAYRWRLDPDEDGVPLQRMLPRALMIPPGVPEFLSRDRLVEPGAALLEGRAWSGQAPIERVEISVDGGLTWSAAALEQQRDRFAWVGWSARWEAVPGEYRLLCRATDSGGNTQPLEPEWNLGGYACNKVQEINVTVSDGAVSSANR